ncbi:MAG: hypothetical protein MH204_12380 [Fimbriimonadaceae bacterium]|nr:hypothetical protein [Fimbriimonadaceae bacterium]
MSKHDSQKDDLNVLEKMGYERRDADLVRAGKAVGISAILTVACFFIALGVLWVIERNLGGGIRVMGQGELAGFRRMPEEPHPLIQSNRTAWGDMVDLHREENGVLRGETADPYTGNTPIPITEAMAKVAEEGLPTAPTAREAGTK